MLKVIKSPFFTIFYAYEQMIDWAKAQGVKVRKGMKKATILQKIEEAGLKYEA